MYVKVCSVIDEILKTMLPSTLTKRELSRLLSSPTSPSDGREVPSRGEEDEGLLLVKLVMMYIHSILHRLQRLLAYLKIRYCTPFGQYFEGLLSKGVYKVLPDLLVMIKERKKYMSICLELEMEGTNQMDTREEASPDGDDASAIRNGMSQRRLLLSLLHDISILYLSVSPSITVHINYDFCRLIEEGVLWEGSSDGSGEAGDAHGADTALRRITSSPLLIEQIFSLLALLTKATELNLCGWFGKQALVHFLYSSL